MKRWTLLTFFAAVCATILTTMGCATLDEKQRAWIFQPSDRSWGGSAELAGSMDNVWICFESKVTSQPVRLHALWAAAEMHPNDGPVLLYLHGARWNVEGSSPRIERMKDLGFSVLAIDYRGFGKSTPSLPSETMAYEDARAAWDWLAKKYPNRPRYIFGHSLGGAVAIDLASNVDDERGTIVEATFTSIPEVAATMKFGWLPVGPLIT
ncbi:MAG: alpha/beta fold hydrolase, partial [Ramlibacter sp.]|nr:alpha/beta fold hydrolase [Ramlibacter sp.]